MVLKVQSMNWVTALYPKEKTTWSEDILHMNHSSFPSLIFILPALSTPSLVLLISLPKAL